jgi:hypothetical protein
MSRIMPLDYDMADVEDFNRMLRIVRQQIPGLLDEMHMSRASMKLAGKGLPSQVRDTLVRASGPLMTRYMQMFSVKLGQALHFEETARIVPPEGGVYIRWFSNVDQLQGKLPDEFLAKMPQEKTLRQGKFSVERQFQYTSWVADDGSIGAHFATFGFSFAVLALVTTDRSKYEGKEPFGEKHFEPGEILRLPKSGV